MRAIRRREGIILLLAALAIASGTCFGYWIDQIPFCTECDHMKKSDLGWMVAPFADNFGYFYPE